MEGSSITLEWRYNFGVGSFRQLLFGNSDTPDIVDKLFLDKVPNIATGYKGRLAANVTDAYTSITFLRVNRTDSTIYTLTIKSKTNVKASSKVEIGVKCKYEKTNKMIYTHLSVYSLLCLSISFLEPATLLSSTKKGNFGKIGKGANFSHGGCSLEA